jgi:hypothetical protein
LGQIFFVKKWKGHLFVVNREMVNGEWSIANHEW